MNYWIDITNTPQVHFLLSVVKMLNQIDSTPIFTYTTRNFSETNGLMDKQIGEGNYISIGEHYGKSYLKKLMGLFLQTWKVKKLHIAYDYSISCGSERAVWNAALCQKKAITFGDNDQARQWTHGYLSYYGFYPDAIPETVLSAQGYKKGKVMRYHGYKEDIYLADFIPDNSFLDKLPFKHYIVVRPENIKANYIRNGKIKSIVPDLLLQLNKKGYNVLYLPRYEEDRKYSENINNVYTPEYPINGLDACYFADAVLTGAGTFAREAACLGIPSFSFFAGKQLLSVDKQLISQNKMFFSRDTRAIMSMLAKSKRGYADLERCKAVRDEISDKLREIIK